MSQESTNKNLLMLKTLEGQSTEKSASPFAHWLSGTFESIEEGSIQARYTVRKDMTNPAMILHGGVMAAIMDDLLGMSIFTLGLKEFYPSINLSLEYFTPAKVGDEVICKTLVVKKGRNVITMAAELRHQDGKLIAQGRSQSVSSNYQTNIPKP